MFNVSTIHGNFFLKRCIKKGVRMFGCRTNKMMSSDMGEE